MKISVENIISFLEEGEITYSLKGKLLEEYELASLFAPTHNGFYFFTGDKLPNSINNSLVLTKELSEYSLSNTFIIISENPQDVYYRIMSRFFGRISTGIIAATAIVSSNAILGNNVQVDNFSVIEKGVTIGDNCIIGSFTHLHEGTVVGDNTIIETHCAIGTQGVAWIWNKEGTERIVQPQLGGVKIGSNCFIGTQTAIVRGSLNESTQIGRNTLMAPGCKIGHGTSIGAFNHFANNVTTGGNSKIGDNCFIGSGAIFRPKVSICENTIVGAGALVVKNQIEKGMTLVGSPARPQGTKENPSGMPKPNYKVKN